MAFTFDSATHDFTADLPRIGLVSGQLRKVPAPPPGSLRRREPGWNGEAQVPAPAGMRIDPGAVSKIEISYNAFSNALRIAALVDRRVEPFGYVLGIMKCTESTAAASAGAASAGFPPAVAAPSAPEVPAPASASRPPTGAPSADALLGFRGTLIGAVIAAIAALFGWLQFRVQRQQVQTAREALEHERKEAAARRSADELLSEGPRAIVKRFSALAAKATQAAEQGDTEAFAIHARSLVSLRDSMVQSLMEAAKPLNSNMQRLSDLLASGEPDLQEAMRLMAMTNATMPNKAVELEAHLRRLLAAIMTVAYAQDEEGGREG